MWEINKFNRRPPNAICKSCRLNVTFLVVTATLIRMCSYLSSSTLNLWCWTWSLICIIWTSESCSLRLLARPKKKKNCSLVLLWRALEHKHECKMIPSAVETVQISTREPRISEKVCAENSLLYDWVHNLNWSFWELQTLFTEKSNFWISFMDVMLGELWKTGLPQPGLRSKFCIGIPLNKLSRELLAFDCEQCRMVTRLLNGHCTLR